MNATAAFLGAKQGFDDGCARWPRPVLVGLDGDRATLRRGPIHMDWAFVADGSVEAVISACRSQMLGTELVMVVPTMTRWGYAACRAFGVGWCDSHGRCDVMVDWPDHVAVHRIWHPVDDRVSSVFDAQPVRDVALFLAMMDGKAFSTDYVASFLEPIQSHAETCEAIDELCAVELARTQHGLVGAAGWPVSSVLLELLSMDDDELQPPDAATSRRMSRIRSRDTKPELLVRKTLHACGIRYRTHVSSLPGTPDLAHKSDKWAVFVNGCFWHAHDCDHFRAPIRNADFWRQKFAATKQRDKDNHARLLEMGFDVHVLWECELNDDPEGVIGDLVRRLQRR